VIDLRPIALRVSVANEVIELGRAVSLGLVINEALTNALKYAFPDDAAGNVTVEFERQGEPFCLEVSDDGIGFAPEQRGSGTGHQADPALAQQLGGHVDWHGPPGTRITLVFPVAGPS
jgi:two-component sensor histidine kinase